MEERKQKYNINNIFYGVIGVATLIVSVIGATFAYFTATTGNNTAITGDMAQIDFDIEVKKVTNADERVMIDNQDPTKKVISGMIPMSNNMLEKALTSSNGVCIDNNSNTVCQVYRITVKNTSTASMFLDGYVTLTGGSGIPTDIVAIEDTEKAGVEREWKFSGAGAETTMRWAQAFCDTDENDLVSNCSTGGASTARTDTEVEFSALGGTNVRTEGKNRGETVSNIKLTDSTTLTFGDVTGSSNINANPYLIINRNYIRISDRLATNTAYDQEDDITSALVYSQYIEPEDGNDGNDTGNSSSTFKDAQVYYIVVWLSETGTNQTAANAAAQVGYFQGKVTFISSQGSEVTATFANHVRVPSA